MAKLSWFTDPVAGTLGVLVHDHGFASAGFPDTARGFGQELRPCLSFNIPDGTPNGHGCRLRFEHPERGPSEFRGALFIRSLTPAFPWGADMEAALVPDDVYLQPLPAPAPVPVPEPPPNPNPDPTPPADETEVVRRAKAKIGLADRVAMLKEVARELNRWGFSSGGRGPFGVLRKDSGNRCSDATTGVSYSCDIIAAGQGQQQAQWDVLIADEEPSWQGPKVVPNIRIDVCEPQLPA